VIEHTELLWPSPLLLPAQYLNSYYYLRTMSVYGGFSLLRLGEDEILRDGRGRCAAEHKQVQNMLSLIDAMRSGHRGGVLHRGGPHMNKYQ
jgi:hypothetical protein